MQITLLLLAPRYMSDARADIIAISLFDWSPNRNPAMPQSFFPRRYYIDDEGRRVLIGLTLEETREFELLDVVADPKIGITPLSHEKRWLELYLLHEEAWKIWMAKASDANRSSVVTGRSNINNRKAFSGYDRRV